MTSPSPGIAGTNEAAASLRAVRETVSRREHQGHNQRRVADRERYRDGRSPRMPEHDRAVDAQPIACNLEQICLCFRSPNEVPGAKAMSEARPVEHDHPVIFSGAINQATRLEILDHAAVPVKENERPTTAARNIVQLDAADLINRPCGGLSRCAFCARCRLMSAAPAMRVAAPATVASAG